MSKKNSKKYDFHDLLSLEINGCSRIGLADLNRRFSYFETDSLAESDITLNLGSFKPENSGCVVLEEKFFVKDNYIYCKGSEKAASFELEIKGFEHGPMEINFDGRILGPQQFLFPDAFAHAFVLVKMIAMKSLQKGFPLVHAAAVEKDGKSFVFFGRGGAFKTSLTMDLIRKKGFSFVSEDWLFLGRKNDEILSFPAALHEFCYRLRNQENENLKKKGYLFDVFSYLSAMSKKFDYGKPGIAISDSSKACTSFLVDRSMFKTPLLGRTIEASIATKRMVYSNMLEQSISSLNAGLTISGIEKLFLAYPLVFPKSSIYSIWDRLEERGERFFTKIPCYSLRMPFEYSSKSFEDIWLSLEKKGLEI